MTIVSSEDDAFLPEPFDAASAPAQFDGATESGDWNDPRFGRVSGVLSQPSIHYVNESGVPEDVLDRHYRDRGGFRREVASIIEKWSQSLAGGPVNQTLDVFNRTKGYNGKVHVHAVMARCAWAVENDEVLSTLADVIEGLMWQKCRFELIDEDEQDVWNQWAADVNLDALLRRMGREEFKVSQFYVGLWWANRTYRVRNDTISDEIDRFEAERKFREYEEQVEKREQFIAANKDQEGYIEPPQIPEVKPYQKGQGNHGRKREFSLKVPTEMTIFDPTKILPVGTTMFGRERFAYIATRSEDEAFTKVFRGETADSTVYQLLESKYEPTPEDQAVCADLGIDYSRLWLFNKDAIFRHTTTRADYERHAAVKLKTILPILEMKDALRASDRASLIGNTNFIVLITKGSDKMPAKNAEIENLREQAKLVARLPVLVGDHRLHVEIVSPSIDNTLTESRWQTLDSRLVFAALKTFSPVTQGGGSSNGSGVSEMSMVVSKGLESRRHMILRDLERAVFSKILEKNEKLTERPHLEFSPKRITLDFNQDVINGVLKLRDRGDISRETTLEELDYDQDREVLRRGRERVLYDRIFESGTPFSSPAVNPYGTQPGQLPPGQPPAPGGNLGPKGQPRTEGGRPPGTAETQPRKTAAKK